MKTTSGPLEWSAEILQEMFRHTPVGVVLTDLHGTILEINDAFCAMLGYPREQLAGRDAILFFHPEERQQTTDFLGKLRDAGAKSIHAVRRLIGRSGNTVWADITLSVVRSRENEPIFGIGFVEDIGETREMEEALRRTAALYQQVVDDQTEMIVRWRRDGTRTFVNEAYARYFGFSVGELLGTSFFPMIVKDDLPAIEAGIAALTAHSPSRTGAHRVILADGSVRWNEWTDRATFDESGRITIVQSIGRDVTDRVEATEAMRVSEARYRRLFEDLPIAAWEVDWSEMVEYVRSLGIHSTSDLLKHAGTRPADIDEAQRRIRVVQVNSSALALAGVNDVAQFREWLPHAVHSSARAEMLTVVGPLLFENVDRRDAELSTLTRAGAARDVVYRWNRIRQSGSSWNFLNIAVDLTERKQVERLVLRQKERLEEAEEIAHLGAWELHVERDEIYGSRELWRILDGVDDGPLTRKLSEAMLMVHPEDTERVRMAFESAGGTGVAPDDTLNEFRVVHADGSVRIVRGQGVFTRAPSGEVRAHGVLQDVTEIRKAEEAVRRQREELMRADRMISLGILVSGVAHEINNPNQFIMLNAPFLRKAWRDLEPVLEEHARENPDYRVTGLSWQEMKREIPEILAEIDRGAERIRSIVSELRAFGRDHDPVQLRPSSLNEIISGSLRLLSNHISRATSNFKTELHAGLPMINANPQRLEQVVVNLVMNSCQALSRNDAAIRMVTSYDASSDSVIMRVTDEGRGIAPDDLKKIRDPFFTTKRAEGGTGLGLAVSDRIVEEHHGLLSFESEPGRGTTATLSLPALHDREHSP